MQKIRNLFLLTTVLVNTYSFSHMREATGNTVVQGVVLSAVNGKPLSNSHVYIVHGEEEALTDSKGQFSIETAKKFPLTITAEHDGYKKLQTTVSSATQKLVIRLQPK